MLSGAVKCHDERAGKHDPGDNPGKTVGVVPRRLSPPHGGAAVGLSLRVAGAVHWTSRWQATLHHQSGCGLLFSAKEGATVLGWLSSDEPFLLYGLAPLLSRPQQGSHEPVAKAPPDLGRPTSLLTLCLSHASAP